jgi:uncharacterized membrane protein YkvA (DUF1232 family)
VNIASIQAVIDSAKARGNAPLLKFIRENLPEATEAEVQEAADTAVEIIETVPVLLAGAAQEAENRNLTVVVQPVLDHAERYFLAPMDLLPEMTMGLAGLLDDAYLVLKVLENLQRGPQPLLDWDLEYPLTFIRRLVGSRIGRQLDAVAMAAMHEISENVNRVWQLMAHEA